MPVSSTANRISYSGNGSTTAFAFPYLFFDEADLVVIETVTTTGIQTLKTLTTHYTVAGEGDPSGGTVTMVTAPASGVTLTIYRDPLIKQLVDLVENDPLPVNDAIEEPLDLLTMIAQRLSDRLDRALRQPEGDTANIDYLPAKIDRASTYLAFDADGDPIAAAGTDSGLVVSAFIETLLDDTTAAAARATLDAASLTNANTFTAVQTIQSTDAGATVGPSLVLDRFSASPAANDIIAEVRWDGRDSGGAAQTYARIYGGIAAPNAASEGAGLVVEVVQSGAARAVATLGNPGTAVPNDASELSLYSNDAGAGTGPVLALFRDSASPASSDALGQVRWNGRDASGNLEIYGTLDVSILDATHGSEDSQMNFATYVAGTRTTRFVIAQGCQIGSPTGGDKGVGTLNATAVYDDNVLLTCYVPESYTKGGGNIDLAKWDAAIPARKDGTKPQHDRARAFQARAERDLDPKQYADFWKVSGHLPALPSHEEWTARGNKFSTGEIVQRLWETVEVQAAHIDKLLSRIEALEGARA